MPDERKFSIEITGWMPSGHPIYDAGQASSFNTIPSRLTFQGTPKVTPGVDIAIPAGGHNAIRVFYFRTRAAGDFTTPGELLLWNGDYPAGSYLATNYVLQDVKVSYEFLTWPFPLGSRKFRLKTLWQFQYVGIKSGFDAPLTAAFPGVNQTSGSKRVLLPTLGIGLEEYVTRNFRLELNGSGFAFPGRSNIWDVDASAAYHFGKIEIRAGGKGFHFRTSKQGDYYMGGTLLGAFVGLRFFPF